ncbi:MAG: VanZ family protein [Magnetococcales bacterium]|nr:VanZ family protein [Magnetococcales bacterium]
MEEGLAVMSLFSSRSSLSFLMVKGHRHRWWWVLAATFVIYGTLPLMPILVRTLFESYGRSSVYIVMNAVLIGSIVVVLFMMRSLPRRHWWRIIVPLLLTGVVVITIDNTIERVHFLEYALLGMLVVWAMGLPTSINALVVAALMVALIGLGDEAIQWILPNRYWDLRDVAMNGVGGALGVWVRTVLHHSG